MTKRSGEHTPSRLRVPTGTSAGDTQPADGSTPPPAPGATAGGLSKGGASAPARRAATLRTQRVTPDEGSVEAETRRRRRPTTLKAPRIATDGGPTDTAASVHAPAAAATPSAPVTAGPTDLPTLDAALLAAVASGRSSSLALLVAEDQITSLCRTPPSYEEVHARFDSQSKTLKNAASYGSLVGAANGLKNSTAWTTLRAALKDEAAYQNEFVGQICPQELARRRAALAAFVEDKFVDDGLLDLAEQVLVDAEAEELGLLPDEARGVIEEVRQTIVEGGGRAEIEKAAPLVERQATEDSPLQEHWRDLIAHATEPRTRRSALSDLVDALTKGRLKLWLDSQHAGARLTTPADAAQRAAQKLVKADKLTAWERQIATEREAWTFLWSAGLEVLDLGWRGVRARSLAKDIGSVEALEMRVRRAGHDVLEGVVARGLLTRWLTAQAALDDGAPALTTAREAEDAAAEDGIGSPRARAAVQALAVALGSKRGHTGRGERPGPEEDGGDFHHRDEVRRKLRAQIQERFEVDGTLSFKDQRELWEAAIEHGMSPLALDDLCLSVQRSRQRGGQTAEIEAGIALSTRGHGGPVITRLIDAARLVTKGGSGRQEAIEVVTEALLSGQLVHFVHGQGPPAAIEEVVQKATKIVQAIKHEEGRAREATRRAWWIVWHTGAALLPLAGTASPSEVYSMAPTSVDGLRSVLREHGPDALKGPVMTGLLSLWLESRRHLDATDTMVALAERAEDAWKGAVKRSTRRDIAQLRVAWVLGVTGITFGGMTLEDEAGVVALDPEDAATQRLASSGILAAWLNDVLGLAKLSEELERLRRDKVDGRTLTMVARWRLGVRSLDVHNLHIPEPNAAAIIEAACANLEAFEAFGNALTEDIARWLITLGEFTLATEIMNALTEADEALGAAIPRAYVALGALGHSAFPVFAPSEPQAEPRLTLQTPQNLAEYAHRLWLILDRPALLPSLWRWLERVDVAMKAPLSALDPASAHDTWDLHDLLAVIGDLTMRHANGRLLGGAVGKRFGHLRRGVRADLAQATMQEIVAWADEGEGWPEELVAFHASGMLDQWLAYHLPERYVDLRARSEHLAEPRDRLQVYLASFGEAGLPLGDSLVIYTPAELITHARDHLDAIAELLDSGILRAWAPQALRPNLDALIGRLASAREELAAASGDRDQAPPEEAPPEWWPLGDRHESDRDLRLAWAHPKAWLLAVNRAALAVAALGGRCDGCRVEARPARELPADQDLDVALAAQPKPGDVPTIGMLFDASGAPCAPPFPTTHKKLSAHIDRAKLTPNAREHALPLRVVTPGHDRQDVTLRLHTTFPRARFLGALRGGLGRFLLFGLPAVLLAALFFGAMASVEGMPEDVWRPAPWDRLAYRAALALTWGAVALLPWASIAPWLVRRIAQRWPTTQPTENDQYVAVLLLGTMVFVINFVIAAVLTAIPLPGPAGLVLTLGSTAGLLLDPSTTPWFTWVFTGTFINLALLWLALALWRSLRHARLPWLALGTLAAGLITTMTLIV